MFPKFINFIIQLSGFNFLKNYYYIYKKNKMSKPIDINLMKTFFPTKGMGEVLFTSTEEEIIDILGKPESREINDEGDGFNSIELYFDQHDISIFLHFDGKIFEYMSIHSNNLLFNEIDFSKENKTTIIDNIEAYYKENKIEIDLQIEKDLPEYIYTYNAIGLTIWFEKEEIVDISVELPQ